MTWNPGLFANQFYNYALALGGLLAFGAIVWGGTRYVLAAGNPGTQSDAKDQITQAIIGLLLLVGAALVLNIINPNLTNFCQYRTANGQCSPIPTLTAIRPPTAQPPGLPCPATCPGSCTYGVCNQALVGYDCKPGAPNYICGDPVATCYLDCKAMGGSCENIPAGRDPRYYCVINGTSL